MREGCASQEFSVRFWGVRGSIACAGPDVLRYGGNTSCLQVTCADHCLIFDAGTGLRYLGNSLSTLGPIDCDLFLTHTHFDHICGLPFFKPFFDPASRFRLWSGHLGGRMSTKQAIGELMMSPLFPVPPEVFAARVDYRDFIAGDTIALHPGLELQTAPLMHPDGATGYRVNFAGRSIAYVTDTEHVAGRPDGNILELIRKADIFIYDTTYTDEEYRHHSGKGHSTIEEGLRLADMAGVRQFVAFHHDPSHDDGFMDDIALKIDKARPGSIVAREGLTLRPETSRAFVAGAPRDVDHRNVKPAMTPVPDAQ